MKRLIKHFNNNPSTWIVMCFATMFMVYGLVAGISFPLWLGTGMIGVLVIGSLVTMPR